VYSCSELALKPVKYTMKRCTQMFGKWFLHWHKATLSTCKHIFSKPLYTTFIITSGAESSLMPELENDNKECWHLTRSVDVSQGHTQFSITLLTAPLAPENGWNQRNDSFVLNHVTITHIHANILFQETITYLVITRQFCLDLSCLMYITYSNALKMGSLSFFRNTRFMRA